jgi:hypothetical protein
VKRFLNVIAFSFITINSLAADNTLTNDSPAAQKERLFQRFVKEMQKSAPSDPDLSSTNAEALATFRAVFESAIVDPSFGLYWDEVPAPTLVGSNALSAVYSFVATNGWNMQTNDCIFDCTSANDSHAKSKPIRGLPWAVIREQEFPAVTHDNILYVFLEGSTTTDMALHTIRTRTILQRPSIPLSRSASIGMRGHLITNSQRQSHSRKYMKCKIA